MLRITVIESTASTRTLKLEGRIAGSSVNELRQLCEEALKDKDHARLTLDLSNVSFIDNEGTDLLHRLRRKVTVTHCSPFLAELLKEVVQ